MYGKGNGWFFLGEQLVNGGALLAKDRSNVCCYSTSYSSPPIPLMSELFFFFSFLRATTKVPFQKKKGRKEGRIIYTPPACAIARVFSFSLVYAFYTTYAFVREWMDGLVLGVFLRKEGGMGHGYVY